MEQDRPNPLIYCADSLSAMGNRCCISGEADTAVSRPLAVPCPSTCAVEP